MKEREFNRTRHEPKNSNLYDNTVSNLLKGFSSDELRMQSYKVFKLLKKLHTLWENNVKASEGEAIDIPKLWEDNEVVSRD